MPRPTATPMSVVAEAVLATDGHIRVRGALRPALSLADTVRNGSLFAAGKPKVVTFTHVFNPMELVDAKTVPSNSGSPNRSRLELVLNHKLANADILLLVFIEQQKDTTARAALQEVLEHNTMLGLKLKTGFKVISIVTRSAVHDQLEIPTTLAL